LPYTVRFHCDVIRVTYPHSFTLKVGGDFRGRGSLHISRQDQHAVLDFDWFVHVERPLFRCLSPVFHRAMAYNHRWSMRHGEQGLIQEVTRRRMGLDPQWPVTDRVTSVAPLTTSATA
jgi:hypothetical protein